ncbi:MAG: aminotransferase class V-fold PLP-dependent enzyme [Lawsonibacter sp.]
MPGHKGLYGPQGTGLLLCGRTPEPCSRGARAASPVRQEMPDFLPGPGLEAGTHNIPGIAGLLEGLRFVRRRGRRPSPAGEPAAPPAGGRACPRCRGWRCSRPRPGRPGGGAVLPAGGPGL